MPSITRKEIFVKKRSDPSYRSHRWSYEQILSTVGKWFSPQSCNDSLMVDQSDNRERYKAHVIKLRYKHCNLNDRRTTEEDTKHT